MSRKLSKVIYFIPFTLAIFLALYGYVQNIVKLVEGMSDPVSMLLLTRLVGITIPPLGCILGFF